MQALTDEKHKEFLALSAAWLEKCPVDAKVHLARASVLSAGGDGDVLAAAHHRFMFYGLLESILASGDGRTKASAYHVIAVDEEYTVLNFLGATLKKQSLDGTLDVLEVDLKGALTTIYFDAALSLAATERALQGSDRKPR